MTYNERQLEKELAREIALKRRVSQKFRDSFVFSNTSKHERDYHVNSIGHEVNYTLGSNYGEYVASKG